MLAFYINGKLLTYQMVNIQSQCRVIIQLCVVEVNEEIEVSPHWVFFDNVMTKSLKKRFSLNHQRQRFKKERKFDLRKSRFFVVCCTVCDKICFSNFYDEYDFQISKFDFNNTVSPKRIKKIQWNWRNSV